MVVSQGQSAASSGGQASGSSGASGGQGAGGQQAGQSQPGGANRGVQTVGGHGQGQGADVFNIRQAFQKEFQGTQSQLERISKDFQKQKEASDGDRQILDKIRQAFQPQQEGASDPVEKWEEQLDYYLAQGYEAEKAGNPIPLTTNLAIHAFKNAIEGHKAKVALEEKIARMERQLQQAIDPQVTINNTAYGHIDNHMRSTLDALYGVDEGTRPQRAAQFNAMSDQVAGIVRELQHKQPHEWDRLRRSPQLLQDLVERVVKQNLPPQAVRILEQEKLANTDMSEGELWQAFREAKQIQDPQQRASIREKIRQEIFVKMHGRGALRTGA